MSRSRREFPTAVRVAVIKRATDQHGTIRCERKTCCAVVKRFQIDHVNPDGLTGKPTLENAELLCMPCHAEKTKGDVADIAEAKRREAKHVGADRRAAFGERNISRARIKSPGFKHPPRRFVEQLEMPARRGGIRFVEAGE